MLLLELWSNCTRSDLVAGVRVLFNYRGVSSSGENKCCWRVSGKNVFPMKFHVLGAHMRWPVNGDQVRLIWDLLKASDEMINFAINWSWSGGGTSKSVLFGSFYQCCDVSLPPNKFSKHVCLSAVWVCFPEWLSQITSWPCADNKATSAVERLRATCWKLLTLASAQKTGILFSGFNLIWSLGLGLVLRRGAVLLSRVSQQRGEVPEKKGRAML